MNRQHRSTSHRSTSQRLGSILFLLSLLLPALAAPAQAVADGWTPFGPGGGSVSSLAVDPGDSARIYAVAGGALYRSQDASATWTRLGGVGAGLQVVVLDPASPSTLFTGGGRLLRSTDGGATLEDVTPAPEAGQGIDIADLAVAPGGAVFAADGDRLLRSLDGGATWTPVSSPAVGGIEEVLADTNAPGTIYYATPGALFKSTDDGATWSSQTPFSGTPILRIALAPSAPGTLYASVAVNSDSDTAFFRSDDGAASWRQVGKVAGQTLQQALLVDPGSVSALYAAGMGGIYKSLDGGVTWQATDQGLPPFFTGPPSVLALALDPSAPDTVYAGLEEWGVAKSLRGGMGWRIGVETGLDAAFTHLLKFDPRHPDTVYLGQGSEGSRSFRSTDGGRTWTPFARSISLRGGLNDLAFDLQNPNVLYASTEDATWRSGDGGTTWTAIFDASEHVAVTGPRTLLAGLCGLNRSTDGGRSWKEVIPCNHGDLSQQPTFLEADPANPANVYAQFFVGNGGSFEGFKAFRSQDGGATWKRLTPGFVVAPSDFRVLYRLNLDKGILVRSADSGGSWTLVDASLPPGLRGGLAVDGGDANRVYLTSARGLWISRDGGRTFQLAADTSVRPVVLVTDRTHPGIVFGIGTTLRGNGLFEGRFEP